MKKYLIFIIALLFAAGCSEEKSSNPQLGSFDRTMYKVKVDEVPMPLGGIEAIQKNIVYPQDAKEKGISGRVMVQAYVDETGKLDKVDIIQSDLFGSDKSEKVQTSDSSLIAAAINAIKNTEFKPGKLDGKNVKAQVVIPILFKLEKDKLTATSNDSLKKKLYDNNPDYFVVVEEMPSIKGGINELMKNIVYPAEAKQKGIQGKVYVHVLVDEEGNVVEANSAKEADPLLVEAAIKAIEKTKFNPGKQKGKPVKVQVVIPVSFKLK